MKMVGWAHHETSFEFKEVQYRRRSESPSPVLFWPLDIFDSSTESVSSASKNLCSQVLTHNLEIAPPNRQLQLMLKFLQIILWYWHRNYCFLAGDSICHQVFKQRSRIIWAGTTSHPNNLTVKHGTILNGYTISIEASLSQQANQPVTY